MALTATMPLTSTIAGTSLRTDTPTKTMSLLVLPEPEPTLACGRVRETPGITDITAITTPLTPTTTTPKGHQVAAFIMISCSRTLRALLMDLAARR
jgi:hypothetical protein